MKLYVYFKSIYQLHSTRLLFLLIIDFKASIIFCEFLGKNRFTLVYLSEKVTKNMGDKISCDELAKCSHIFSVF